MLRGAAKRESVVPGIRVEKPSTETPPAPPFHRVPTALSTSTASTDHPPDTRETDTPQAEQERSEQRSRRWQISWQVAVVGVYVAIILLCLVSAFYSIMNLVQTRDTPSSSYKQVKTTRPHNPPGLIFVANELRLIDCVVFNLTSLALEELRKEPDCSILNITLSPSDTLDSAFVQTLPDFLAEVKSGGSGSVNLFLLRGPSDWQNKETVMPHMTIPATQDGIWAISHWSYAVISHRFLEVLDSPAESAQWRWELARDLFQDFSLSYISVGYRSFFLMSKQEFQSEGTTTAVRIDLEISLMSLNESHLDAAAVEAVGVDAASVTHVEVLYQWKDGYYMVGNLFQASSPWLIVTILASALLMVERGYNTFMRYWSVHRGSK